MIAISTSTSGDSNSEGKTFQHKIEVSLFNISEKFGNFLVTFPYLIFVFKCLNKISFHTAWSFLLQILKKDNNHILHNYYKTFFPLHQVSWCSTTSSLARTLNATCRPEVWAAAFPAAFPWWPPAFSTTTRRCCSPERRTEKSGFSISGNASASPPGQWPARPRWPPRITFCLFRFPIFLICCFIHWEIEESEKEISNGIKLFFHSEILLKLFGPPLLVFT